MRLREKKLPLPLPVRGNLMLTILLPGLSSLLNHPSLLTAAPAAMQTQAFCCVPGDYCGELAQQEKKKKKKAFFALKAELKVLGTDSGARPASPARAAAVFSHCLRMSSHSLSSLLFLLETQRCPATCCGGVRGFVAMSRFLISPCGDGIVALTVY